MEIEDRCGMMRDQDVGGVIDVTSLSSPGGKASSSGYCSADEDHNYTGNSRSQSRDISQSATPESHSVDNSQPQTPTTCGMLCGELGGGGDPLDIAMDSLEAVQQTESKCGGSGTDMMMPADELATIENWLNALDGGNMNFQPFCSMAGTMPSMTDAVDIGIGDVEMMDLSEDTPVSQCQPQQQQQSPSALSQADTKILIGLLQQEANKDLLLHHNHHHQNSQGSADQQMVPGEGLLSPSGCTSAELSPTEPQVSSPGLQSPRLTSPGAQLSPNSSASGVVSKALSPPLPGESISINVTSLTDLHTDSDGNVIQGTDDMSSKFVDHRTEEMFNTSIASYLGQGIKDMDNSVLMMSMGNEVRFSVPSSTASKHHPPITTALLTGLALGDHGHSTPITGSNPFLVADVPVSSSPVNSLLSVAPRQQQQIQQREARQQASVQVIQTQQTRVATSQANTYSPPTTMYIPTTSGMSCVTVPQTPLSKSSSISLLPAKRQLSAPASVTSTRPSALKLSHQPSMPPPPKSAPLPTTHLDDHRYTCKQQPASPKSHKEKARSPTTRRVPSSSVLETLLTTQRRMDPQKGSEAAMAAEGISQLHLGDSLSSMDDDEATAPLLKQLLTGKIDQGEVQRNEQQVIDDRQRGSLSHSLDLSSSHFSDHLNLELGGEPLVGLDDNDQGIDLGLLGAEPGSHGNRIWTPSSPRHDLMSSELDEILQEQMRQDDLWLQHYFDSTL